MFARLFGKKPTSKPLKQMLVAQLNAKLQPMDRGEHFEKPLEAVLRKEGWGELDGGGTMQERSGEIAFCDVSVLVDEANDESAALLIAALEALGAPKGSRVTASPSSKEYKFGRTEGLAVYLNGTDLPDDVYKECDSNFVVSEFERLLGSEGRVLSHWQGPTETALYIYGSSFQTMQDLLSPFIKSYPLCQKCRVIQTA